MRAQFWPEWPAHWLREFVQIPVTQSQSPWSFEIPEPEPEPDYNSETCSTTAEICMKKWLYDQRSLT
eukprot:3982794-Karenia_brevis.AAC.1